MRLGRCLIPLIAIAAASSLHAGDDELVLAMNMYASQQARTIGDLLTIVVEEEISSNSRDSLSSGKSVDASAEASLGDPTQGGLSGQLGELEIPPYKIGASTAFSGSGEQALEEALSTRFTVRVVDVLENGVLVVQGDRRMVIKGEEIDIAFSGLVRPNDVTAENTVQSSQISDARITYDRQGEVSRGARPGWLWRIFEWINPW